MSTGGHIVLSLEEFFAQDIPDQAPLLGPIHESDVGFLAAWRGTGKTLFNLSCAVAIAGGYEFLGWEAPSPRPVLYVDGEMPFSLLRAHLNTVIETFRATVKTTVPFNPKNLRILTPDVQPDGLEPDLGTKSGRQRMDDVIADASLVVLDNLSALVGGDAENDSEAFEPVRRYQKSLRRRGVASILVHHAGKGGDQRGHSGKEDLLDFSALLEPPTERVEASGARFKLRWKKIRRDIPGLRELDITLIRAGHFGQPPRWEFQTIGEAVEEIVIKLAGEGHSQREIVSILRDDHGIRKSTKTVNTILQGKQA
jgi:putative DNA primase/helicase